MNFSLRVLLLALLVFAFAPAIFAEDAKGKAAGDLDALLLEGLSGGESDNLPAETTVKTTPQDEPVAPASPNDHPLIQVNRRMREAERLLSARSESTGRVQTEIVDALDKLIKECEKQCQCSGGDCEGGECKPGSKPGAGKSKTGARDSSKELVNRKVELGDLARRKSLLKAVWGQLPKRQQDQMVEGEAAQFLPKYAEMIEEYFQTLAERGAGSDVPPEPSSAKP